MREVDASIRSKVGTTEILVTVECRKRGCKGDDTWIEQLATKRQKIGAARTIAVSAKGFTKSATKSAKHFGIDLRTLSKVSASDIASWFLPGGAVHIFRLIEDVHCFIVLYDDSGEPSKYGFFAPEVDAPVFYQDGIRSPFPIGIYISILERTDPELFAKVPFDGSKVELTFPIQWDVGSLLVATSQGKKSVHLTKLIANVSYQSAVCDLESGVHHEYSSPEGATIQHTAFNTELFGLPVKFEHQADSGGGQKTSCTFLPDTAPTALPSRGALRRIGGKWTKVLPADDANHP